MSSASGEALVAPQPLFDQHDLSLFDCEEASLNEWLRRRARGNQATGASRTFVVCAGSATVVGYYCLSAGTISHQYATGPLRRNMPDPVPMMLLGRLAVDRSWNNRGIGSALLKDAILRTAQVADQAGVRGIMVHAISDQAKRFYAKWGFAESPADPMTLMVRLTDIAATIRAIE
ncbi:MAG: GCN5-related N-acetyltransferase protein [Xanthobacteraceae bacterium]|jgi:predicted N-acetyltransferase YhbS|nr:GCN5-related N-acetyltransferase protein [Xanthobacteraceae bacterium]